MSRGCSEPTYMGNADKPTVAFLQHVLSKQQPIFPNKMTNSEALFTKAFDIRHMQLTIKTRNEYVSVAVLDFMKIYSPALNFWNSSTIRKKRRAYESVHIGH